MWLRPPPALVRAGAPRRAHLALLEINAICADGERSGADRPNDVHRHVVENRARFRGITGAPRFRGAPRQFELSRDFKRLLVGVSGFEPPAPASRRQCSTKLSYTPDRRSRNGNSATREHVAGGCGGRKGVGGVLPATCGAGGAVVSTRRFGGFRRPCLCRASLLVTASLGASPSGKAAVFGTAIPRFESWRPSQLPGIYSEKALGRKIATSLGTETHPTSGDSEWLGEPSSGRFLS